MLMAMKKPSDADPVQWLDQAKNGDHRAFEHIYRATSGAVYGVCLRMTADVALAEECVQRTYVKAWKNLARFEGRSRLETWLHRIAVNEILTLGRRERQLLAPTESVDSTQQQDPSGALDLEKAIARLPERQRQVFVLHAVYGHGHRETGRFLNIATGTSKAHFHRARQLLKELLSGDASKEIDEIDQGHNDER